MSDPDDMLHTLEKLRAEVERLRHVEKVLGDTALGLQAEVERLQTPKQQHLGVLLLAEETERAELNRLRVEVKQLKAHIEKANLPPVAWLECRVGGHVNRDALVALRETCARHGSVAADTACLKWDPSRPDIAEAVARSVGTFIREVPLPGDKP